MVFHLAHHDGIPWTHHKAWIDFEAMPGFICCIGESVGNEVDSLRRIFSEYNLACFSPDKIGERFACTFIGIGGFFSECMCSTVHRRIRVLVVVSLCVEDLKWFLRRSPTIEVHQRDSTHTAAKNGEILAHLFNVKHYARAATV